MQGGAPSAGCAYPKITPGGRFVVFQTGAVDITPGDTNLNVDVYLRDRLSATSERISLASDGTQPNAPAWEPAISGDGRYVAFRSEASNLVPLDTNVKTDIFVRDRQTLLTERVSVSSSGAQADGPSIYCSISRDGRYVAFESTATNLVAGDTNNASDIFVRDRQDGTTRRVSVGPAGIQANGSSTRAVISGDGHFVIFYSSASNLVAGDTNGVTDLFGVDLQTNVIERLSVATDGTQANNQPFTNGPPAVSGDGRYAAFYCEATNLVPSDRNNYTDVFVRDRVAGTTERVSLPSDGSETINGAASLFLGISDDGRFVTFEASAKLVPEDFNDYSDIYVVDRQTGQAELVSATNEGTTANKDSFAPAIDASGRFPVFPTFAGNLDSFPGQGQLYVSLFARDRGPQVGILEVKPSVTNCSVAVQGTARYAGAVIADGADPANDGGTGAMELGGELTGASLIYRPEVGDVFARIRLASIPGLPVVGGGPGALYVLAFKVANVSYEVRATRLEAGAGTGPQFLLFQCEPNASCNQTAVLKGGIGTSGNEVRFSMPLGTIGAVESNSLTDVQISTGEGSVQTGIVSPLDQMLLPAATLPERHVTAGFALPGTPESGVQFTVTAGTADGAYYASLGILPPGTWDLWARACFGAECTASSTPVQVSSACGTPVQLTGVVSRKTHGGAGTYDIVLPSTGSPGIECRSGGANGDHTLVFTFANALTTVGGASISSGIGMLSGAAIDGGDPRNYIVNLTGVTNAQNITVNLADVNTSGGGYSASVPASMSVLLGDTTADTSVNSADISQTKSRSGQGVGSANFRSDVNVDGSLNSADISLVKSKSGTALP